VAPLYAMDGACAERRYRSYYFISALGGGEWSASRPGRPSPPGTGRRVTHRTGVCVDAEARGKIFGLSRGSNPCRPVRSQTELRGSALMLSLRKSATIYRFHVLRVFDNRGDSQENNPHPSGYNESPEFGTMKHRLTNSCSK
jgi:hypothetical protein